MKVLFVHNSYGEKKPSGEEHALQELCSLLEEHGHEVRWFKRSSDEVRGAAGSIKAFFTGIYNPSSAKALGIVLDDYKPDVVQVQNIYPLISSSIFKTIKERRIPVVMRCPNYRLFCPNGLCLQPNGKVCEKCFKGKEWNCIIHNCEHKFFKSLGYALRNLYSRKSNNIRNGVDFYIVQSEFQKGKFEQQGIDSKQIGILPGICSEIKGEEIDNIGEYVSFVGRVSSEKGIYDFIKAARMNPTVPFKVAGKMDSRFSIPRDSPSNLEFVGFLSGNDLNKFYVNSRIIVVPSRWYEGFPNVITRAMLLKRPVITTDIGAMPSIIEHGKEGLNVKTGDSESLGESISLLYLDINLCRKYGENGRMKAMNCYSRESVYTTLYSIYDRLCK